MAEPVSRYICQANPFACFLDQLVQARQRSLESDAGRKLLT
jgi:hypothetical protein